MESNNKDLKYFDVSKLHFTGRNESVTELFDKLRGWEKIEKEIERRSSGDISVLDVGCNDGRLVSLLEKKGIDSFGVDLSMKALKRNKRKFFVSGKESEEKISNSLVCSDAKYMPFKPDSFDYIICSSVLHHLNDKKSVMNEFSRVLKPRGNIIVCDPNKENLFNGLKEIVKSWTDFFSDEETFIEINDLKELLSSHFKIKKSCYMSNVFAFLLPFMYELLLHPSFPNQRFVDELFDRLCSLVYEISRLFDSLIENFGLQRKILWYIFIMGEIEEKKNS